MLTELRKFLLRGNVVELAVGVILGLAFNGIVNAFVTFVLSVIAALFGDVNFDDLSFTLSGNEVFYGPILTAIVTFLLVGVTLFFLLRAVERFQRKPEVVDAPVAEDTLLLREIRDNLTGGRAYPPQQRPGAAAP
jgi:large conductance mechanosensitive channel